MPPFGKLDEPPIHEVVCGVFFKPLIALDPLVLGGFWHQRRKDFPRRELKTPILANQDGLQFSVSNDVGPVRTWLISETDVFILQIQQDRFYLNWRARDAEYPCFDDEGERKGLLSLFMKEFIAFSDFILRELGQPLELEGLELSKLNRLLPGRHWLDTRDLGKLLPVLEPALELRSSEELSVSGRAIEKTSDGFREWAIEPVALPGPRAEVGLRLELRRGRRRAVTPAEVPGAMRSLNEELNRLFEQLVPELQRFKKGWRP